MVANYSMIIALGLIMEERYDCQSVVTRCSRHYKYIIYYK